jgi:type IV pilus assembly protein PilQ
VARIGCAWLSLVVAATPLLLPANPVLAQSRRPVPTTPSTPAAASDGLQLKVRRLPDAVELVLEQAGLGASLTQQPLADRWQGDLRTDRPRALKVGPQSLALPAEGFERISFDGRGDTFRLTVTPVAGRPLASPVISSDGRDLVVSFPAQPNVLSQTARPNLRQPTPVPIESFVPPLRPRAVAPPVGDMAVGTMTLENRGYIKLNGPPVTLTTRGANARDVLMVLAQMGGYGFVYVDHAAAKQDSSPAQGAGATSAASLATNQVPNVQPVTVSFRGEAYSRALNAILMGAGLQARVEGKTIFAGPNVLSKSFGPQLSKVYRLNQVGANSAADYLANLGASVTKTNTITTAVTQGANESSAVIGAPTSATTQSSSQTTVEAYGASTGPLMGLRATTDTRLGTITLVGDSSVILIAEQYLKQLDLRQRQVALSLRILDVNLDNDSTMSNSFAIRWGNNFIVNDNGQLLGAFGNSLPPTYDPQAGFSKPEANPGLAYPKNEFYDFLRAQIVSSNTKLLASPTLILQENASLLREGEESAGESSPLGGNVAQGVTNIGLDSAIGRRRANEGVVRVGTNVVTDYRTQTTQGAIACTPLLSTAGLVLGARVEKIDDNGFVTFVLSPSVSAITDTEEAPTGCGSKLSILSIRSLDTGALRVRDGQTLIMTGVISDSDRAEVRKWPILGDIPFIGSLFRASGTRREKRELVIMVTPKIINDELGGAYGYGFRPETDEARRMIYGPAIQ